MKYKPPKSYVRRRDKPPIVETTPKGVVLKCPFCSPSHPILPGVEYPCGTLLEVKAVQNYLISPATKKIHCIKCGATGGEMIPYRNGFVHSYDCAPGTKLLTEIPPFSKFARIVYFINPKLRKHVEKYTGLAKELQEIDAEGKQTGKVLGYFFWKG